MKAVILAAGEGVRLQPITSTRPKHLINVGGRPILTHCLNAVKTAGIDEAVVVIRYMGEMIREHFGDGKSLGMNIEYAEQKGFLGTGNAASVAEPYVRDDFLLVYGDLLFSVDAVKSVVNAYNKEKPSAAMGVVQVDDPESYGIVELEDEKFVKRIVEKPKREDAPTDSANAGIYVFSAEIFETIRKTPVSTRGEWEITDAISLLAQERKKVAAAKISKNDWLDIGRPWDLLEANRWVLSRMKHKVKGQVEIGAHLIGPVTVAESARVRSGAYVEGPALIDAESDVGPNCYIRPSTSIGRKVRVGNACEIKNSIVMDGAHIGHLSYVGDCVVGENCNFGAGTMTANYRFDAGTIEMTVKDKVVDSGRKKLGTVFGDNVKTGINALLMPGVKIGNDSWVGPGVVVYRDLSAKTALLLKQDSETRELG